MSIFPFRKPKKQPQVDVCVLSLNQADMTVWWWTHFMDLDAGADYALWLLDNGSEDGGKTERLMRLFKAWTRWPWSRRYGVEYRGYKAERNVGFSAGNNYLARKGSAPWILFINNDAFPVAHGWLKRMLRTADQEGFDAIGPISNAVMGLQNAVWNGEWPAVHRSQALSGFCLLIKRDVFEKLGMWDEDFFHGSEDLALSWLLLRGGYAMGIDRHVYVDHWNGHAVRHFAHAKGQTLEEHYLETNDTLVRKYGNIVNRSLLWWEHLRRPRSEWAKMGVYGNGIYLHHPGGPLDGQRRTARLDAIVRRSGGDTRGNAEARGGAIDANGSAGAAGELHSGGDAARRRVSANGVVAKAPARTELHSGNGSGRSRVLGEETQAEARQPVLGRGAGAFRARREGQGHLAVEVQPGGEQVALQGRRRGKSHRFGSADGSGMAFVGAGERCPVGVGGDPSAGEFVCATCEAEAGEAA